MGWFNKQERGEVPELPELPRLPELPSSNFSRKTERELIPQLPSIPRNQLGEKFSQNMIKEAVTGERESEDDEEGELNLPSLHLKKPMTREIEEERNYRREIPQEFIQASKKVKEEPIFIRIDKFEESLKIFERTKERIYEIEKMLKDIRRIREEETRELEIWEQEIQNLKNQIEKVDQDIFSRIE